MCKQYRTPSPMMVYELSDERLEPQKLSLCCCADVSSMQLVALRLAKQSCSDIAHVRFL
jgi:hypothetical protein